MLVLVAGGLFIGAGQAVVARAETPAATIEEAVLAQERHALDRWSQGDPLGYLDVYADDVTYFDDIGANVRVDGLEAMRSYLTSLVGEIPAHRYEIVDPKVQVYGDIAVLTFRYHPTMLDGEPETPWKATSVYRQVAGQWRIVHGNWSEVKDQGPTAGPEGQARPDPTDR